MAISLENGINELSLNSRLVFCIHFSTNDLRKGKNPSFLLTAMSSNQPKRKKTQNSKNVEKEELLSLNPLVQTFTSSTLHAMFTVASHSYSLCISLI